MSVFAVLTDISTNYADVRFVTSSADELLDTLDDFGDDCKVGRISKDSVGGGFCFVGARIRLSRVEMIADICAELAR